MIDTSALDEAVRRFPRVLRAVRDYTRGTLAPETVRAIQREYHAVLAERDRVATRAWR